MLAEAWERVREGGNSRLRSVPNSLGRADPEIAPPAQPRGSHGIGLEEEEEEEAGAA